MIRHLSLGIVAYLAVALIQIPAVVGGIHELTGLWWLVCVLMGVAVGSLPIFGSLLGIRGAEDVWGWSTSESYVLFVGIPLFFLTLGVLISATKALYHRINANVQQSHLTE
jgi:hypothetical protein